MDGGAIEREGFDTALPGEEGRALSWLVAEGGFEPPTKGL